MKKIFSLILVSGISLLPLQEVLAQSFRYANEALLFSRTGITGSARIRAMGGAQTSLGGDISSVYSNPAGLGFYNRSEVSLSPSYLSSANDADYLGLNNYDFSTNLHMSNMGLVLAGPKKSGEGWLGGNFGISYQRINNFNDQFSYEGLNPENGLVDVLIDNFAADRPDLLTDLAYATYLVGDYQDPQTGEQFLSLVYPPDPDNPYEQRETVTRRGSQNQLNISYGGNISDRYFIGGGVGLINLNYRMEKNFSEIYFPEDDVNSFQVYEEQMVRGSGINATLGFIARPIDNFTFGISYQTPTIYDLEEEYYVEMDVVYNNVTISDYIPDHQGSPIVLNNSFDSETTAFNYNLRAPSRLNLGGSFFFEKQGFISADVEFVNYGNSRLTDSRNLLREDNQAIQDDFTSAINVRLGGEYRFDIFRLRAGYALQGDPYQDNERWNRGRNMFSGGAGLRLQSYYIDLAVTHEVGNHYYYPYAYGTTSPLVSMENRRTLGILTFGLNF